MDIVVIGAGISGLACAFELQALARERGMDLRVRVLEADVRVGGKIETRRVDGFLLESAANAWLGSKKEVAALAERVGLAAQLRAASSAADTRYILHDGRLQSVPVRPGAFVRSALLGPMAKLRILREPFAPAPSTDDETVAEFVRRRLGPEMLDRFVDPFVSGVFAGDPEQMSLSSCFPRLHELERDHGGLIRGMIATMRAARAARRAGDRQADPSMRAAPSGGLLSLAEGMGELTAALRDSLLEAPETGAPVGSVERRGSAWRVSREDGTALSAEKVVIAAPAYRAAPMLRASDSALAAELDAIPHNAVAVVALGWHEEDVPRPLDGYGFLVPFKEGRSILGSLWESTVFPGRAPAGCVLTRTMVGGTRRPELVAQSEEALVRAVRAELADILGVRAEPLMARVVRHQRAIPQYHRGHRDRLERIASRLAVHPGLYLAGNAYRGVSISDCVVQARRIALAVLD